MKKYSFSQLRSLQAAYHYVDNVKQPNKDHIGYYFIDRVIPDFSLEPQTENETIIECLRRQRYKIEKYLDIEENREENYHIYVGGYIATTNIFDFLIDKWKFRKYDIQFKKQRNKRDGK